MFSDRAKAMKEFFRKNSARVSLTTYLWLSRPDNGLADENGILLTDEDSNILVE